MEASYQMLLYCISVIASDFNILRIKTIYVTTSFYNYLEAIHQNNEFMRQYQGNTLSYIMGIPVVIDDEKVNDDWAVQFEENNYV